MNSPAASYRQAWARREMADAGQTYSEDPAGQAAPLRFFFNLIGAVTSLALIVGIGIWGYRMVVRDVSGVPVVRASQDPMRIAPDDPGGQQAPHQGLSVNAILAEGAADDPPDRLILAPAPLDLTLESVAVTARTDSGQAERGDSPAADEATLRLARAEAVAEALAEGVEPLQELPAASAPVTGGIGRSLRPRLRPQTLATSPEAVALAAVAGATVRDIDPDTIPVGTRLAQLGAFASREIAIQEWDRLAGRFDEYLADKNRVIQKAESGGRTFYRLRAMGFSDLSEARRFCSALVAERVECIPVVVR